MTRETAQTILIVTLAVMLVVQWWIQHRSAENKLDRDRMIEEQPDREFTAGVREGLKLARDWETRTVAKSPPDHEPNVTPIKSPRK